MPPGYYDVYNDGLIHPEAITTSMHLFICSLAPEELGYDLS